MARPLLAAATSIESLLAFVSLGLLLALFLIFLKEWRRNRSTFSLGLVLFSGIFLAKEALRVLIAIDNRVDLPLIGPGFALLASVGEVVGLAILLFIVSQ